MSLIQSKMKKIMAAALTIVLIIATSVAIISVNGTRGVSADDTLADSLLYRLEMNDESDMFANTAGTEYADATAPEGNSFSVQTVNGRTGLNLPGGSHQNYLQLPTGMFEGKTAITVAGWFYIPEDIEAYACEMTIYSATENAILRSDPWANYHGDAYLFNAGDNDDVATGYGTGVKPIYSGWYHMAYVIDSEAHTFTVYQNGAEAYTETIQDDFSVAEFAASDAAFYLGQNAAENSHGDYKGVMSDIRVYGEALSADELKAEYGYTLDDFQVSEYNFDNSENYLEDSVRGYDMAAYRGDSVLYQDGTAQLTNGTGLQAFDVARSLNNKFAYGLTKLTISMDLNIQSPTTTSWKRIFDMYSTDSSRLTFMAYCDRDGGRFFEVAYYENGDDYQMLLDTYETELPNNEWFNLTVTIADDTLCIYIDGELFATCQPRGEQPDFSDFLYKWPADGTGNLTFGTNTYEEGNNLDVTFDNIRIWAAEATAEEVAEIAGEQTNVTLSYNANGGNEEQIDTTVQAGTAATVAVNTFTRDGYRFIGWNTQADGEGTDYAEGSRITISEDTVLYAQWEINAYFITFDSNGGRGEMTQQAVGYEEENVTIKECGFSKTGYTFTGWNAQADGEGTAYAAGGSISLSADITLYAQWAAKEYTVTFDANGGEGTMQAQDFVYDTEEALSANVFTRAGYDFAGWAYTSEGIAVFEDGETVTGIAEGNDITLYAVWVRSVYEVKFDANGGTGTMDSIDATSNAFVTLPENTFTNGDREFLGWATSADGEVVYEDGDKVIFEGDTTLYAVWSEDGGNTGTGDNEGGDNTGGNTDGDNSGDGGDETSGGCSGAAIGSAAAVGGILVAGAALLAVKKRKNS